MRAYWFAMLSANTNNGSCQIRHVQILHMGAEICFATALQQTLFSDQKMAIYPVQLCLFVYQSWQKKQHKVVNQLLCK